MEIITSCLAILGAVSGAATLHGYFTGLKTGNEIRHIQPRVERLSDHILYTPSIQQVHAINETSDKVSDLRELREMLEPVQTGLNQDILSTAVLSTPSKLKEAFRKDPFEVLIETRPVGRAKKPSNPDLLPIFFHENGVHYVGWQTRGVLPLIFNCDYSPEIVSDAESERAAPKHPLRSEPRTISDDDVRVMIKTHNFFSKKYGRTKEWCNESGDFQNDFVDNRDGTVTDRVTGKPCRNFFGVITFIIFSS